jgi:hypothetical protein
MTVIDPFETAEKVPAVTFKDKPIGTSYTMTVRGGAEKVQGRDFETGEMAVWKNKDGSTPPKYSAVIPVTMEDGEDRALWAVIPSAMFAALQEARKNAGGVSFAKGGKLVVQYYDDKPNEKNPRLNPAKQYRAKYDPPGGGPDPFTSAGASSSAAPTAQVDDSPPW